VSKAPRPKVARKAQKATRGGAGQKPKLGVKSAKRRR
jgi:hypothetical protein